MKRFFHGLSAWWFATMTPERAPLTTIQARETMRKRRLLSIILLIAFSVSLFIAILRFFVGTSGELLSNLYGISVTLLAIWFNRQGYLKFASFIYLLTQLLGMASIILILSSSVPVLTVCTWPMLLLLVVVAGLFLPEWGVMLIASTEVAFLCRLMLYERQSQMALIFNDPTSRVMPLIFGAITIIATGVFSTIHAWATNRAVIKADRAIELEQANQALTEMHSSLETAYDKLEVAHEKIQKQALTDPLTGLPNHRAIVDQLEKEVDRTQRFDRSFSLLFFDIDHFKALNDGYGHASGDVALNSFGQLLAEEMRSLDTVGRWGGEEFVAILPETTVQEAQVIAERLRQRVSQQIFAIGGGIHLTCSIGVASYPEHATTLTTLVDAADQAMYAAKRLGRNQVRVIDDSVVKLVLSDQDVEGNREGVALHGIIEALTSLVEQRDASLSKHSDGVAELVYQLIKQMGTSEQEAQMVKIAAQLHDIGKVGISDAILHKPARLTEDEWQQMRAHTVAGAEIVSHVPALRPLAPVIRAHHERWDGCGYPDQLQGEEIPLASRVISVADAYTAMIVDRAYQKARSSQDALAELRRCAGTQFDPLVVESLIRHLHEQAPAMEVEKQAA